MLYKKGKNYVLFCSLYTQFDKLAYKINKKEQFLTYSALFDIRYIRPLIPLILGILEAIFGFYCLLRAGLFQVCFNTVVILVYKIPPRSFQFTSLWSHIPAKSQVVVEDYPRNDDKTHSVIYGCQFKSSIVLQ